MIRQNFSRIFREVFLLKLLNVGFENFVSEERVVSVLGTDSAPIKRLIRLAKESGNLIDASCGRKTQSVIIMNSDHVVLSALTAENLVNKISRSDIELTF